MTDPRLTHRTINSLACDVGFGDQSYFNRTFRRRNHATPSQVKITAKMERSSVPVAVAHGRFWHRTDRYRCRRNCVSFRMSYRRVQPPAGTSAGASDDGESRIKIFITGAAGYIGGSRPDRYRPTGDKHQQDQRSQPGGYIDQILKGAKPGELAIYQGSKFGPLIEASLRACFLDLPGQG